MWYFAWIFEFSPLEQINGSWSLKFSNACYNLKIHRFEYLKHVWQLKFRWICILLSIEIWVFIVWIIISGGHSSSNVSSTMDNDILRTPIFIHIWEVCLKTNTRRWISTVLVVNVAKRALENVEILEFLNFSLKN